LPEITLTESDGGRVLQATVGTRITIVLPENPTTGYRWSQPDIAGPGLQLVEHTFRPPAVGPSGAGSQRRIVLLCAAQGDGVLSSQLVRSWQAGTPLRRFSVTITVT
jgi:inhibitor of cysteine peptidase